MFGRVGNSWALIKASAAVLRKDRELVIFPIVSMVASIILMISFALPMWFSGAFESIERGNNVLAYVVGFLFYLCQYTIIFFCNTALVGAAMIRLRGGDPTVNDGLRIASQRFPTILGYAFIAATVGMVLKTISERVGILGKIVVSLIGFAWNVATFLVVPVLVMENVGPTDAIKRSSQLLKQTWGEQVIGNTGMGLAFGLLTFALIMVGVGIVMVAASIGSMVLLFGTIAAVVLAVVALGLVGSALSGIYTAAVYNYAMTGQAGGEFSMDLVQNAFRAK
jgi:hypothetical protein